MVAMVRLPLERADSMPFAIHYEATKAELAEVCAACERNVEDVTLIAVSKTVDANTVGEAIAAGAHNFGENRPEMLADKASQYPQETWHFIGNIQSRKIPDIVAHASLVHSLFKESHLEKFDRAAKAAGKVQDVLLEVNVSGELSKSGLAPAEVKSVLEQAIQYDNLRVCGLMTMAPQGDLVYARKCFDDLRALQNQLKSILPEEKALVFNELSMGMSEDWREAIAAGATMIRVGRALFSDSFA